ncbi:hypothetical protein EVAR_96730_1 [Eumeta japonica]|uniref:Uncharacterized protein n=1 Tax=Eumeta variegata TaxID=151549 RepID=A0A4C1STE0_EUMVA|nr:hypothetical protein EVAR_96730_1 [Eumeta japonica]
MKRINFKNIGLTTLRHSRRGPAARSGGKPAALLSLHFSSISDDVDVYAVVSSSRRAARAPRRRPGAPAVRRRRPGPTAYRCRRRRVSSGVVVVVSNFKRPGAEA